MAKKVGRPRIEIDYTMAEKYGAVMCTIVEIASLMGVSVSRLEHDPEFMQAYKRGLDNGKSSLRRSQYKAALAGNPTMLIWLGKQYLGQSDKQQVEHVTPQTINVRFEDTEQDEEDELPEC